MKTWLKGGLMGMSIYIIILILDLLFIKEDSLRRSITVPWAYFFSNIQTQWIVSIILYLFIFFVIGVLIGKRGKDDNNHKMSYWLIGGIFGFLVYLVIILMLFFGPIIPNLNLLVLYPCGFIIRGEAFMACAAIGTVGNLFLFVIIGATIGLIIGKIKSKGEKK